MQFGFDDIDRAGTAIAQIVHGDEGADGRIEHGLRHIGAVDSYHVTHHVVAHIAHQHQAAPWQSHCTFAVCGAVVPIGIQTTCERAATFRKLRLQSATHQSQPIAIGSDFVLSIDRRYGILQILYGGHRRFEQQIADTSGVRFADRVFAVDLNFDVQPVMLEQYRSRRSGIAAEPHQRGHSQGGADRSAPTRCSTDHELAVAYAIPQRVAMRAGIKREVMVEKFAPVGDHLGAAYRVIRTAPYSSIGFRQHIGAIECVVQTAPTGVGRIERVACIAHRHHQLRARDVGDLRIDVRGINGKRGAFRDEIADLTQHRLVRRAKPTDTGAFLVPLVKARLQRRALGEQRGIDRGELTQQRCQTLPESIRCHTGARKNLLVNECQ